MKRIIIGAAALAAATIPTTTFAVYSDDDGQELLDSIIIDRVALDAVAGELCEAARGMSYGMTNDEVVETALVLFVDNFPEHDPASYVYVAGLITGCLN